MHAILTVGDHDGVEEGIVGAPEVGAGNGERNLLLVAIGHWPAVDRDAETPSGSARPCAHRERCRVGVGVNGELLDVRLWYLLKPWW